VTSLPYRRREVGDRRLPSVTVLLFTAPASRHKLKPTISALPGRAAAATIHDHGTGPFKKRPAELDSLSTSCSSADTSPSTAWPVATKCRLPLSQTRRSTRARFAVISYPSLFFIQRDIIREKKEYVLFPRQHRRVRSSPLSSLNCTRVSAIVVQCVIIVMLRL
jgi:hypothetical protein